MNCVQKAFPSFSLHGQARMLSYKGTQLLHREFGSDIKGSIYKFGNQLFELFCDAKGTPIMVKPATVKTLDLYLEAVNIRDAFA